MGYPVAMDWDTLFAQTSSQIMVPAGETVFRAGEPGSLMYVLIDGSADILVGDTVVEHAAPGALLGEMALIDEGPRTATVVAVTDCRLISINVQQFHSLIQKAPPFATKVMRVMADRLRVMDRRLLELQTKKNT
ncbi:MAG: Crp/Fnr family transcriptional regulator [Burkholderiales bacterium]